jgi:hypothetical protein
MTPEKDEEQKSSPLNMSVINTLLNVALTIMVIICLAKISGQNNRIEALVQSNSDMVGELELVSARLAATHAETELMRKTFKQELQSYKEQMTELLEAATGKKFVVSTALDSIQVAKIPNGVYSYKDKIRMVSNTGGFTSTYENEFSVTVIKTEIGSETKKMHFVIGIGTTVGVPQFFVDYDGDKLVDLELMRELVDFIPFADVINRKMSARNSQNLYDNYLLRYDDADYVDQDAIDEKGGIASQLYKVITDKSDIITKWVK